MSSTRKSTISAPGTRSLARALGLLMAVGLAVAGLARPAGAQFSLGVKRDFTTGNGPQAQALADLNGDGRLDLVTANTSGNSVSVLPGLAGGGFGAKTDYTVGNAPAGVVVADLNDDDRLDLATANTGTNTITLLFGNGAGLFAGRTDIVSGSVPRYLLADDFNGDDRADLMVPNLSGNNMSVFLARPGGGFSGPVTYATGVQPISVASLDYNRDGLLDVVVANAGSNTISLFPGDGRGAFGARTDLAAGTGPRTLAVGDLNGDALPDVAVPNFTSNNVSVFLGTGTGLGARTDFVTAGGPLAVGLGDVTGDGIPDLVAGSFTLNGISLLSGTGTGSFNPKTDLLTGTNPRAVNILDMNGDGARDIVLAHLGGNVVSVLENGGTFSSNLLLLPRTDFGALGVASRVAIDDATGDDRADVVVTNPGISDTIVILMGNGAGAFPARINLNPGSGLGETRIGDLNRDGLPDLVSTVNSGGLFVLLGRGGGQFANEVSYSGTSAARGLVLTDLNADGYLDAVVEHQGLASFSRYLGNGDGTFDPALSLATPAGLTGLAVGDVTGDGFPDVITGNGPASNISLYPGNALGTFPSHTEFALPGTPSQVVAGDLNGDGLADVAVIHNGSATLSVFLATGGSLGARADVALGGTPTSLAMGNVGTDDAPDLVFVGTSPGVLWMLPGDGRGGFGARADFASSASGNFVALGDINADGRPDVASVLNVPGQASVYRARSTTRITLTAPTNPVVAGGPFNLTATVALTAPGGATPTGTVRFYDGLTEIASGTLTNGAVSAFVSLAVAGRHSLSAVYVAGDPWFGAISGPAGVRVVPTAAPALFSIADIKSDQGKQVRLKFNGSGFDYNGSPAPIGSYVVFRKSAGTGFAPDLAPTAALAEGLSPEAAALVGWDLVASLPALTEPSYEVVVPTLADSNGGGIHRATFMVRAVTPSPGLYYDSAPDSGYSVDNLPPAPPAALAGAWTGSATALNWNDNSEADLWHYRVYRGGSAGFTPGAGNLVATRATSDFADAGQVGQFYKVSALDVNGNESGFTLLTPSSTTGVDDGPMPLALALRAVPRERSGGRLLVRVALPTAEPARLELLDVGGRQVAGVAAEALGAGEHEVDLGAGRVVASGIYIARLTQGAAVRTLRVVHLR